MDILNLSEAQREAAADVIWSWDVEREQIQPMINKLMQAIFDAGANSLALSENGAKKEQLLVF